MNDFSSEIARRTMCKNSVCVNFRINMMKKLNIENYLLIRFSHCTKFRNFFRSLTTLICDHVSYIIKHLNNKALFDFEKS